MKPVGVGANTTEVDQHLGGGGSMRGDQWERLYEWIGFVLIGVAGTALVVGSFAVNLTRGLLIATDACLFAGAPLYAAWFVWLLYRTLRTRPGERRRS